MHSQCRKAQAFLRPMPSVLPFSVLCGPWETTLLLSNHIISSTGNSNDLCESSDFLCVPVCESVCVYVCERVFVCMSVCLRV